MWKFTPLSSPWIRVGGVGGSWESIIKLAKRQLKLVLKDRPLYKESLRTFLINIEFTLNIRSLLPLSDDINYLDALKPNWNTTFVLPPKH